MCAYYHAPTDCWSGSKIIEDIRESINVLLLYNDSFKVALHHNSVYFGDIIVSLLKLRPHPVINPVQICLFPEKMTQSYSYNPDKDRNVDSINSS